MLLHLLLLSKPEDEDGKSRWKSQLSGEAAATSCESPSGLNEELVLVCLTFLWSNGLCFALLGIVVLFGR